ncbi:hypothetical protein BaRGS_00003541 [Batillaria attramentaria]|uniref:Uncharacterized protein n=1 Tax=Batillaria attramentaria TaxID=370345 RepID=A0ABD0M0U4_9CAEN
MNLRDVKGRTALMIACRLDQTMMVMGLLQEGADPEIKDRKGFTAVWWACHGCCEKPLRSLSTILQTRVPRRLLTAMVRPPLATVPYLQNHGCKERWNPDPRGDRQPPPSDPDVPASSTRRGALCRRAGSQSAPIPCCAEAVLVQAENVAGPVSSHRGEIARPPDRTVREERCVGVAGT